MGKGCSTILGQCDSAMTSTYYRCKSTAAKNMARNDLQGLDLILKNWGGDRFKRF